MGAKLGFTGRLDLSYMYYRSRIDLLSHYYYYTEPNRIGVYARIVN